jgi:hypothetical protein
MSLPEASFSPASENFWIDYPAIFVPANFKKRGRQD